MNNEIILHKHCSHAFTGILITSSWNEWNSAVLQRGSVFARSLTPCVTFRGFGPNNQCLWKICMPLIEDTGHSHTNREWGKYIVNHFHPSCDCQPSTKVFFASPCDIIQIQKKEALKSQNKWQRKESNWKSPALLGFHFVGASEKRNGCFAVSCHMN